jgi:hypothetical protein
VTSDEAVVIGPIGAGVRQEALGDFAVEEPVVVGEHGDWDAVANEGRSSPYHLSPIV